MIPQRYEKAEYADVPASIKKKFESIRETKRGIFIHGSVGTGKTHIAYALKKKWDEDNPYRTAIFWNTPELLHNEKQDFDKDSYSKKRSLERLKDSKQLLILDDIGTENATGWALDQLYMLINKRYNEMKPVIFTSNLSIEDVGKVLGDRIASRIVEMCDVVELGGDDKRLTINKTK